MAILKVARLGHPVLRKMAESINPKEIKSKEVQQLIDDMIETMHEYEGLGLAAPQVHQTLRLSVVELQEDSDRYPDQKESLLYVFINPELEALTKNTSTYWEGCLSVPGMRGLVARPNKVKVKYLDRKANPQEMVVDGFLATVLQHEFDHLDGKLYVDRLVDSSKFMFEEEYQKYWLPDAGDDY